MNPSIEINPEFRKALDLLEQTSRNVFVTGKAGTGKSTLLTYFRTVTQKKIVVLAPTGVAALNVQGETIHSFFGFKPDITVEKIERQEPRSRKKKIYKTVETLVIDEVSMMRADLVDCVDTFLRLQRNSPEPFGGVQMIFIGDLYQLPPVVTSKERALFTAHYPSPYFFDAKAFAGTTIELVELEKIYRQKDRSFIQILNSIRNNSITPEGLALLNERVGEPAPVNGKGGYVIHLTTTNLMAQQINGDHLSRLKKKVQVYPAEIAGRFEEQTFPADLELSLAPEAQVMFLNNDSDGRWVNGTLGRVVDIYSEFEGEPDTVKVQLPDKDIVEVIPHTWEIFHFKLNETSQRIETETIATFTQYPLKLAWAITIHKSQGKTFERCVIDLGNGAFATGQTYVALSRCTSLEGIVLKSPIKKSHVLTDWRIVKFMTRHQYALSERDLPLDMKIQQIEEAIQKKKHLEILYLKAQDEKSRRVIRPIAIGKRVYLDKEFLGLDAFCMSQEEKRVFRVDRILEMKIVELNEEP